jgi:hypothetical protein
MPLPATVPATLFWRVLLSPSRRRGILWGVVAGGIAGYVVMGFYFAAPFGHADMDQIWWSARAILQGEDPYSTIGTSGFPFPLYYPLTSAIIALPLGFLGLPAARLLFIAGGSALLGYVIGRDRSYLWPTFFGLPFLISARSGQWAPLLTAGILLPGLAWLATAKPNVGLAMLAGARTRRQAMILLTGGAAVLIISLAIDPHWPWKWRDALAASTHFRPLIMRPGGVVMLAALLCWRDPDARLLLALAVIPQTGYFYEALPACVVAKCRRDAAIIALATHIATLTMGIIPAPRGFQATAWTYGTLALWLGLVPPLLVVLHRRFRRVPFPSSVSRFPAPSTDVGTGQIREGES